MQTAQDKKILGCSRPWEKQKSTKNTYFSKVERYALPQGEVAAPSQSIPGNNVRISLQGGDTIETAMLIGADGFRSAFVKTINKIQ
jgi:hypothetical protein